MLPIRPNTFSEAVFEGPSMLNALKMQQQELQKAKLFNQFYGPRMQADIAGQNLTNQGLQALLPVKQFQGQFPGTTLPGLAGQLYAAEALDKNIGMGSSGNNAIKGNLPISSEQINKIKQLTGDPTQQNELFANALTAKGNGGAGDVLRKSIFSGLEKTINQNALAKQNLSAKPYISLPKAFQAKALAHASGFGYTPEEAAKLFVEGNTLGDLAEAKGYGREPKNWPQARYAPTTPTLTRQQRANVAIAGVNAIEPIIAKGMAPYAKKFAGYSPKAVYQQLKGGNEDELAAYFGARALQPEISMLRSNAFGVNPGITAIKEFTEKSLGNAKAFESFMTPSLYEKTQKYINNGINAINKAENGVVNNYENSSFEEEDKAAEKVASTKDYTEKDIENTAKKYNMTREEVIKILESKNG